MSISIQWEKQWCFYLKTKKAIKQSPFTRLLYLIMLFAFNEKHYFKFKFSLEIYHFIKSIFDSVETMPIVLKIKPVDKQMYPTYYSDCITTEKYTITNILNEMSVSFITTHLAKCILSSSLCIRLRFFLIFFFSR